MNLEPALTSGMPAADRNSPGFLDLALDGQLRQSFERLAPEFPHEPTREARRKPLRAEAASLLERRRAHWRVKAGGVTWREKGSGIDRLVEAEEIIQLPAPDLRSGHRRTVVTIFGPRPFEQMDRDDRIRACYQHCALRWVMSERMTNQSLRERFHLPEGKAAIASQVIAATIEAGLVKPDEKVGASRRFARYLPFWA
ncbi:MAG: hypothetical protein IPJ17_15790 [Holophagales bacterium]|nr:MAG: hypothetical protein IPJ17_15790 [Holophagales bacterium]